MHRLINRYIPVALFFIGLCVALADSSRVFLEKEFSVAAGQVVTIEGEQLVIKFKTILEDSRCPINAVCVWVGNGKVELEILDIDGQNKTVILNTEDEPKEIALKGHKLKLLSLNPPRIDGVSLSSKDYAVVLRVERTSSD